MPAPGSYRRFRPAPSGLVAGSLATTSLLWFSNRFGWPVWHKGYAVLAAVAVVGVAVLVMILWFAVALIFHRRFQYSIRSLLVLVLVVALLCSWLALEMRAAKRQKEAIGEIQKSGVCVEYDWQVLRGNSAVPATAKEEAPEPKWLCTLLGDDFFANVVAARRGVVATIDGSTTHFHLGGTATALHHLKAFRQLRSLDLGGVRVADAELETISGLTQLQFLYLRGTEITSTGLEHLKGLRRLQELCLTGTKVADAGVEHQVFQAISVSVASSLVNVFSFVNNVLSYLSLERFFRRVTQ